MLQLSRLIIYKAKLISKRKKITFIEALSLLVKKENPKNKIVVKA